MYDVELPREPGSERFYTVNLQFFDQKKEKRIGDAMIAMVELMNPSPQKKNFMAILDDESNRVESEYEEEDEKR